MYEERSKQGGIMRMRIRQGGCSPESLRTSGGMTAVGVGPGSRICADGRSPVRGNRFGRLVDYLSGTLIRQSLWQSLWVLKSTRRSRHARVVSGPCRSHVFSGAVDSGGLLCGRDSLLFLAGNPSAEDCSLRQPGSGWPA